MKKSVIAILFLVLGILVVPLGAWVYLNYGIHLSLWQTLLSRWKHRSFIGP